MPQADWEQPGGRRRVPRAALAAVAVAAVVVLGWLAGPTGGDDTTPERRTTAGHPGDEVPAGDGRLEVRAGDEGEEGTGLLGPGDGWQVLPHAPLVRRYGHSTVWTGTHLVVWGGARSDERHHGTGLTYLRSGASYDPATGRWRRLPPSPLDGRLGQVAVAARGEMVVWGAARSADAPTGAAFDPRTGMWRELASGPLDGARPGGAAWTGEELVVWGDLDGRLAAAAHRLDRGSWRGVPPPPLGFDDGARALWTDGALLAWTPLPDGERVQLATWEPGDDRWRLHRPLRRAPGPMRFVAAGDRVLAWGGPAGRRWAYTYHVPTRAREEVRVPPVAAEADLLAGYDGHDVLLWSGAQGRGYRVDPGTGAATALPAAPLEPRTGAGGDGWPGGLVLWGGVGPERHYNDGAVLRLATPGDPAAADR